MHAFDRAQEEGFSAASSKVREMRKEPGLSNDLVPRESEPLDKFLYVARSEFEQRLLEFLEFDQGDT